MRVNLSGAFHFWPFEFVISLTPLGSFIIVFFLTKPQGGLRVWGINKLALGADCRDRFKDVQCVNKGGNLMETREPEREYASE
jgi:hypothetical protein